MTSDEVQAVAQRVLFEEARALDEQRFEDWLAMYARDAIFWVPAWTDDGRLTSDPETELSLIHCTQAQSGVLRVSSVATTHAFNIKRRANTTTFALVEHELTQVDERWLITRKTFRLQNDYIATMMDFYTI